MRKKSISLLLALCLALVGVASAFAAEVGNRDLQMTGGLAAVNKEDSFFFAQTSDTEWGLFSVSTCTNGPMTTIKDKTPNRMMYANTKNVYYLAKTSDGAYTLESVEIGGGKSNTVLEGIGNAYVENGSTFLYTTKEDPTTLLRFDIEKGKKVTLKTMKAKNIWDASEFDETTYFLTHDAGGAEQGYMINPRSGKAVNTAVPNPKSGSGILYEGYLVYTAQKDTTKVYSVPLGTKGKSTLLGEKDKLTSLTLSTPRFGTSLYPYDKTTNSIIQVPLDGSQGASVKMNSASLERYLIGGNKDVLLVWDNGEICLMNPTLSMKTALFTFDLMTDGMQWTNLVPVQKDYVLVMGYTSATYNRAGEILPTSVRVVSAETGETIFNWPVIEKEPEGEKVDGVPVDPPVNPDEIVKQGDGSATVVSIGDQATTQPAGEATPAPSNEDQPDVSDEEDTMFKP